MTKAELLSKLEPYEEDAPIVFVTFEGGQILNHDTCTVARDHCTTCKHPDGTTSMPVAIYLDDQPVVGKPSVLGG